MHQTVVIVALITAFLVSRGGGGYCSRRPRRRFSMIDRIPNQVSNMHRLVEISDEVCKDQLRMDRISFVRLCELLGTLGGLSNSKHVSVQEKVAMFLSVLSHHTKNRVIKHHFLRSGQTISKYFHAVLAAILKLHSMFLVQPSAITDDCTDPRWKCFKGCLGALDGTYIEAKVPEVDKPRYRNRKGQLDDPKHLKSI
ncbi:hypothetical protein ACS0TY_010081 [Phlomoides rotata]